MGGGRRRVEGDEGRRERENNEKWGKELRNFSEEDGRTSGSQGAREGGQHYVSVESMRERRATGIRVAVLRNRRRP